MRASEIFNAQVLIISTFGPDVTSLIAPSNIYNDNQPLLILGHIAGGHGEHYVSLRGPANQYIDSIQEAERLRIFPDPDEVEHSDPDEAQLSDLYEAELSDPDEAELSEPHKATVSNPSEAERSDTTVAKLSHGNEYHGDEADAGLSDDAFDIPDEAIPSLPEEIMSILDLDMSMIGTFNTVSPQFRELTGRHLPSIYIRSHFDLSQNHDTVVI